MEIGQIPLPIHALWRPRAFPAGLCITPFAPPRRSAFPLMAARLLLEAAMAHGAPAGVGSGRVIWLRGIVFATAGPSHDSIRHDY
jgi:hypothetical protein